jgi:hypothetical protein
MWVDSRDVSQDVEGEKGKYVRGSVVPFQGVGRQRIHVMRIRPYNSITLLM